MNKREKEKLLQSLNFVFVLGGPVQLGTKYPLVCKLEGQRKNETPIREVDVDCFWINKFCVTNIEFEKFNPNHLRPLTAPEDKSPVTNITYLDAISYAAWLSQKHGLNFTLPTEPEWILAASPFGYEFTYKRGPKAEIARANVHSAKNFQTLVVDDDRYGTNYLGLYHIGGNVDELTLGWYDAPGHYGAHTDGAYCIIKGGDFAHCDYSAGVQRRGLFDVADRSPHVGFRLAQPNFYSLK